MSRLVGGMTPRSYSWRVKHYLGSIGHIVGMLFAIAGILLFSSGLTAGWLGVALIVFMYVTGYFAAQRQPRSQVAQQHVGDAIQVRDALDEILAAIKKRVSADIYFLVRSIRDSTVFTLENSTSAEATDPDIHVVRRAATTYLPEALSTYLALPRGYAEREPVHDGKTAHDVLIDQLTLMDRQARRVAEHLMRTNSQHLVTHGRFITERYSGSALEVPEPPIEVANNADSQSRKPADSVQVH